jgi:ribosomal protein L37AE/L43A
MMTTNERDVIIKEIREDVNKESNTPEKKVCPYCGSEKVETFDADNDWCLDCKKWFPGT